jgi:hypothetical protein
MSRVVATRVLGVSPEMVTRWDQGPEDASQPPFGDCSKSSRIEVDTSKSVCGIHACQFHRERDSVAEPDLLGTGWLRRNHAECPAANRPPIVHEDLMIVYVDPDGTTVRALCSRWQRRTIPISSSR